MPLRPAYFTSAFARKAVWLLAMVPALSLSQTVAVGKGSYLSALPASGKLPSDSLRVMVDPRVTSDFKQPVITNEWWSSFLYLMPRKASAFRAGMNSGVGETDLDFNVRPARATS